ncbi:hypothetical protein QC823_00015 [Halomonas vilamensis]|uniref:Uncharacterized protein n=1 Tax=Vreelandella vilamensis TaxID=531309 RepID=A0ABU1GZ98_9GAMM|nr:hypothetical protein [Halomonas vilamensis]MDR5897382.1 hypothetical protein [Halomonas vilamensis]
MGPVCFIIDALVTGAQLPRHLANIRSPYNELANAPIVITAQQPDPRLARLQYHYQAQCLMMPALTLGARFNGTVAKLKAEWLIIALQKKPLPPGAWAGLTSKLDAHVVDAILIKGSTSALPIRLLQRLLTSTQALPPYLVIHRSWLERLGGFDPELDSDAISDFFHRLNACPTRWNTLNNPRKNPANGNMPP